MRSKRCRPAITGNVAFRQISLQGKGEGSLPQAMDGLAGKVIKPTGARLPTTRSNRLPGNGCSLHALRSTSITRRIMRSKRLRQPLILKVAHLTVHPLPELPLTDRA